MKRDMDLVRSILKDLSESSGPLDASTLANDSHGVDEVAYHIGIMIDAGLITGRVTRDWSGNAVSARADALTWSGNDFLDAVANDVVWAKVKKTVGKSIGSATLDMLKALAVKVGTEYLFQCM